MSLVYVAVGQDGMMARQELSCHLQATRRFATHVASVDALSVPSEWRYMLHVHLSFKFVSHIGSSCTVGGGSTKAGRSSPEAG